MFTIDPTAPAVFPYGPDQTGRYRPTSGGRGERSHWEPGEVYEISSPYWGSKTSQGKEIRHPTGTLVVVTNWTGDRFHSGVTLQEVSPGIFQKAQECWGYEHGEYKGKLEKIPDLSTAK